MSWERWLLVFVALSLAVAYYGLVFLAVRDLYRRPAVRGGSKFGWIMIIVCIPIVGALAYGYAGAASFLPRVPIHQPFSSDDGNGDQS